MAVTDETKEQQQIYNIFRSVIYIILLIELFLHMPLAEGKVAEFAVRIIAAFKLFNTVIGCKIAELVCVGITCIGTKPKKAMKFNMLTMVVIPLIIGFSCILACILVHDGHWGGQFGMWSTNRVIYLVTSVIGIMLVHQGGDAMSKYYNHKLGDDRFNFENESFEQSTKLQENDYSVNIPMIFYWKGKMHEGWINVVNPFRGTWVVGTPGSGKTFSVIEPFIRQHSRKGFAMVVYDYKFPTLSKMLYYHYLKNKKYGNLPENCGFRIVNFSNVEYSSRVNPIQSKYIEDLAAASETAQTLIESLNKGGGGNKGGSDQFFKKSSINFLASIIFFFVNYHPTGYKDGKKLKQYCLAKYRGGKEEGNKLLLKQRGRQNLSAGEEIVDNKGVTHFREILNFQDRMGFCLNIDSDGRMIDMSNGFQYNDADGSSVTIVRTWYEDENGNETIPETVTGEFSDMPHVLSFMSRPYDDIFRILMGDPNIMSLMAPFQSAWKNGAMDQLEGMVGTLRVDAASLVSPEAYWVFSGDDFDLKVSDPRNPSYLVIANDPEKEQVIGALNALILNRLVSSVNTKGNLPCSIIVDELPTLYFHKIDRLIGTARSNKVSVTMGFQEIPQLEDDYGKVGMQKVISTCGNVFAGQARAKETLTWLQNDIMGKNKQITKSVSINDNKVSTSYQEKMDYMVQASKISDLSTGWICGQTARDFVPTDKEALNGVNIEDMEEFKTTKFFCKTNFDTDRIEKEKGFYVDCPKIYTFAPDDADEREESDNKNIALMRNFKRINDEVDEVIREIKALEPMPEDNKDKKDDSKK